MTELTIERLFRDFAISVQKGVNEVLGLRGPQIDISEEEIKWWCGHIRDAVRHSIDELPSNNRVSELMAESTEAMEDLPWKE